MSNNGDKDKNESEPQVPEAKGSEYTGFLKSLSTFSGDLATLSCPSFLLSGVSTLEYGQYWADYPNLFGDINQATDEVQRMLNVLRWYISTLYGSFKSRSDTNRIERKPFNPPLGEQFLARWENKYDPGVNASSECFLISEQVSHHPPVSAIYLESKAGVSANGHTGQKTYFKATAARIDVVQVGHIIIRLRDYPDKYLITLPSLQILGLWRGAPYVELSGSSYIQSQNFNVTIEFTGKGWISGEKHTFNAVVRRNGSKTPLYTANGLWSGRSTLEDHTTKEKTIFFDVEAKKRAEPIIAPEEEQNELESRKLWKYVAKAINEGDFVTASQLKGEIEQRQRDKVKRGEKTVLQHFDWVDGDDEFLALDNLINERRDEKYRETGSWVYKNLASAHKS